MVNVLRFSSLVVVLIAWNIQLVCSKWIMPKTLLACKFDQLWWIQHVLEWDLQSEARH